MSHDDLMPFDLPSEETSIIKVIGVGGGGSNAVNYMYKQGIRNVNFAVFNTDAQALAKSPIPIKMQLGASLTEGRGAGNDPEIGKKAATESIDDIKKVLSHSTKMVFITAGMGGGTGTGAAPVVAKTAKDMDLLTIGIVTIPFRFEGQRRIDQAIEGIGELSQNVDALLVINNEKIREIWGDLKYTEAFSKADNVLAIAAKGIAEIITVHGHVNVDFADVRTVMKNSGVALMGSAVSEGTERAIKAIKEALNSPLLNNNDIKGAKNILLNIISGSDEATMDEITQINDYVQQAAGYTADLIWGSTIDENLGDKLGVTVIATGFECDVIPEIYRNKAKKKEVIELQDKKKQEESRQPSAIYSNTNTYHDTAHENPYEPTFTVKDRVPSSVKNEQSQANVNQANESVEADLSPEVEETLEHLNWMKSQPQKTQEPRSKVPLYKTNIEEYESVPAYVRKGVKIEHKKYSVTTNVSKFSLSEDEQKNTIIKPNNSYLHDRVD